MAAKMFERMEANPFDDWSIANVKTLAKQEGLEVRGPKGSHYVVMSNFLRDAVTVPFKRPVKPYYIKKLVGYVGAHRDAKAKRSNPNE